LGKRISTHQEILFEDGPSDTIFLYIHGIMGSPIEFEKFVEALPLDRMHTKAILLPGHGQDGKAFIRSNYLDWQTYVNHEVGQLVKKYQNIYLMGHSMGGLLALIAASQFPVKGILLLNTPIKTRVSINQILISARVLLTSDNNPDPLVKTYRDTFSIGLSDWWTIPFWLSRLLDIDRLAKKTLSIIDKVQAPVNIIQSVHDETVNPISAHILKHKLPLSPSEIIMLQNSTHAYFPEKALSLIKNSIHKMINEIYIKVV